MKGKTYWRAEIEGNIFGGVVVEHMLYDADVVVHYEIVDSYMPRMGIQTDWYRPCNTNQPTTR